MFEPVTKLPKVTAAQQREALHRTIWGLAEDLRNEVDAWDFKQYVLGTLFYRFLSEDFASYIDKGEHEYGDTTFSYAALPDEDAAFDADEMNDLIKERGCFILPSQLFGNVLARARAQEQAGALESSNLNVEVKNTLTAIEHSADGHESEDTFRGLFDDFDTSSTRLGGTVAQRNRRLFQLMDGVARLDLGDTEERRIDIFGDAYEFLMRMYASSAGKSGGEYFTPPEVSRLLMEIALDGRDHVNKVYENCTTSLIRVAAA